MMWKDMVNANCARASVMASIPSNMRRLLSLGRPARRRGIEMMASLADFPRPLSRQAAARHSCGQVASCANRNRPEANIYACAFGLFTLSMREAPDRPGPAAESAKRGEPMKHLPMLLAAAAMTAFSASAALADQWDMPMAYPATNFHSENGAKFAKCVADGSGG